MTRTVLGLLVVLSLSCNRSGDGRVPPAAKDPKFDKEWTQLAKDGAEPLFIEGELHGSGLMGEVRRAVDPLGGASPLARDPVNGPLPDVEVVRVIRANLAAVKGCYQVEE